MSILPIDEHGKDKPENNIRSTEVDSPQDTASWATGTILSVVGETAKPIDPVVEARVLRKIDYFFMPAMLIGYGLVYYDKAILGSAALFGMPQDLALSYVDYSTKPPTTDTSRLSWATSIFYFGMLAGSYPMTFVLQRFTLARVLGPLVFLWAIICASTAGVTTWHGLFAQRFFLGFVESVIPTGFMTIVSNFYTQEEQALRQAFWFSSTGWFTIIGGALNYGFGQITSGSLKRWQYIYIFAGCLTAVFSLWCFCLPNSPISAWFLTKEERLVAVERLRKGQTGTREQKIKLGQVKEALLDIKVWLIFIMMGAAYTINGAVSGFGPLIVSTFGYNTLDAILFQFPLGGITAIFVCLAGWLCSRVHNLRIIFLVACCLPVIAGCIIIWKSEWGHRPAAPVVGYSIIGFFGPVVSLIITLGASNVAGATKKSFMAAGIFVFYNVGNIIGPQLINSKTKDRHYPELWIGLIICYVITVIAALILYFVLWRANKQKERLDVDENSRDRIAFHDLTDKENPFFRYVL
ncbi:hypothetical protein DTO271D3_7826 [Paecilomyces variotii]|nr:hypothetical protein DTO271D3_7826 [Paecilomyces variotii]